MACGRTFPYSLGKKEKKVKILKTETLKDEIKDVLKEKEFLIQNQYNSIYQGLIAITELVSIALIEDKGYIIKNYIFHPNKEITYFKTELNAFKNKRGKKVPLTHCIPFFTIEEIKETLSRLKSDIKDARINFKKINKDYKSVQEDVQEIFGHINEKKSDEFSKTHFCPHCGESITQRFITPVENEEIIKLKNKNKELMDKNGDLKSREDLYQEYLKGVKIQPNNLEWLGELRKDDFFYSYVDNDQIHHFNVGGNTLSKNNAGLKYDYNTKVKDSPESIKRNIELQKLKNKLISEGKWEE